MQVVTFCDGIKLTMSISVPYFKAKFDALADFVMVGTGGTLKQTLNMQRL